MFCYGFEVYDWADQDIKELAKLQNTFWRILLQVGGRAPAAFVQLLLGSTSCIAEWRARRVGLFVRLICSPAGSWTQVALITLHDLQTPWFQQAVSDIRILFPGVTFRTGRDAEGVYLYAVADGADCNHKLFSPKRRSNQIGARHPGTTFSKKTAR